MDIVIVAFIVGAALIFLIIQAVKNINKLNNNNNNNNKCSCDCKNCNCQNKHRKLI